MWTGHLEDNQQKQFNSIQFICIVSHLGLPLMTALQELYCGQMMNELIDLTTWFSFFSQTEVWNFLISE